MSPISFFTMDFNIASAAPLKAHPPTQPNITERSYPDFKFQEITNDETKLVVTIAGDKGTGKTTLALGQEGEIYAFCFDHKTNSIKKGMYDNDKRIHVIDAVQFLIEKKGQYQDSAEKCFDYVMWCLSELERQGGCDWVVFDGLKILGQISEQKMRKEFKFEEFKAFGKENAGPWRRRNQMLRELHRTALRCSKKGVIYTCYFLINEITGIDGSVRTEKIPHYSDVILQETDIVLFAKSDRIEGKKMFFLECDSSKRPEIVKTGNILPVTNAVPKLKSDKEV